MFPCDWTFFRPTSWSYSNTLKQQMIFKYWPSQKPRDQGVWSQPIRGSWEVKCLLRHPVSSSTSSPTFIPNKKLYLAQILHRIIHIIHLQGLWAPRSRGNSASCVRHVLHVGVLTSTYRQVCCFNFICLFWQMFGHFLLSPPPSTFSPNIICWLKWSKRLRDQSAEQCWHQLHAVPPTLKYFDREKNCNSNILIEKKL